MPGSPARRRFVAHWMAGAVKEVDLLIVSYYFPPLGGSGALRPWHLARALRERGLRIAVLCATPWSSERLDETLAQGLQGIEVLRTGSWDPYHLRSRVQGKGGDDTGEGEPRRRGGRLRPFLSKAARLLLPPDPTIGWMIPALRALDRFLRNHRVLAVLSSHPPITSHFVGARAAGRAEAPLFVDYRDLWLDCPYDRPPTSIHHALYQRLERKLIAKAKGVVAVNEVRANRLRELYPEAAVTVIENGFDPEEIRMAPKRRLPPSTLLYVGTVVEGCDAALIALSRVLSNRFSHARLVVAGTSAPAILDRLEKAAEPLSAEERFSLLGFLPHRDVLGAMKGAAALVISGYPEDPYTFSSKIYEYLAVGRPILGILPERTLPYMADLVRRSGGAVAPADDEAALGRAVTAVMEAGRAKRFILPEACEPFAFPVLAEKLEKLIGEAGDSPVGA